MFRAFFILGASFSAPVYSGVHRVQWVPDSVKNGTFTAVSPIRLVLQELRQPIRVRRPGGSRDEIAVVATAHVLYGITMQESDMQDRGTTSNSPSEPAVQVGPSLLAANAQRVNGRGIRSRIPSP
jgi:hypothetical protein